MPENKYVTDRKGRKFEIYDPPFYRSEFNEAHRYIIDEYGVAEKDIAVFIPCALRKPYSESPSHKLFQGIIDGVLEPEQYHKVIFGSCGVVPSELELMYPFANYHYMLGKCKDDKVKQDFHEIEVGKLLEYFEKTKDTYRIRIAYCIGPFRKAMVEACRISGTEMHLLPSDPMIDKMYDIDCPFPEGSLSMQEYIDEFRAGLMIVRDEVYNNSL